MLVDVSHLSEQSFWDVSDLCKGPFIASHSNSKAICSHRRNLTDDQILAINKSGGTIGINLCPDFLANSGKANISDIIRHIEYIASLAGIDCIALGSDFDGIHDLPEGIKGVQDIRKIFEALLRLNYTEETLAKIAGENIIRIVKEVL